MPTFNSQEEVNRYVMQSMQTMRADFEAEMQRAYGGRDSELHAAMQAGRSEASSAAQSQLIAGQAQMDSLLDKMRTLELKNQMYERMGTPGAQQALKLPGSLKVPQVESYEGTRKEDVDAWLFKVTETFKLSGVTDDEMKIMYAGQLLKGNAGTWFYSVRRDEALNRVTSWAEFRFQLKQHFVPTDQVHAARDEIYRITQGTSDIRTYSARFLHLSSIIQVIGDPELKHMYIMGLRTQTKQELSIRKPSSFADALDMAEQYETAMYSSRSTTGWQNQPRNRSWGDGYRALQQSGAGPMELNAMEQGRQNGPPREYTVEEKAERERRRRENLCFECGKPDHARNQCPDRQKRQGNGYQGKGQQPARPGR
jgi:hypothetical protein